MDFANVIDVALMIAGFATLVVGYRRDDRKIMLAAAILLFLTGTMTEFSRGFAAGIEEGIEQRA